MANIIQDYIFFENGGINTEGVLSVINGSILQIEVQSMENTENFNLSVEAQMITNDNVWYPIAIISDKEYALLSTINKNGLYKVDLIGFSNIKITNKGNGLVTCKGRVVGSNG